MTPDDPRHGTEAGHEQHSRDGETACEPCTDAKLRAARRRTKRKTMGHLYTRPLGALHAVVQGWRDGGASLDDIGALTGLETSQVWRMIRGGPEGVVYARTWTRLAEKASEFPLTTVGVTRRIQALSWLGYSPRSIAAAAGVNNDTVLAARERPRDFTAQRVKTSIAEAYDRLHMTIPQGEDDRFQAGITRMRNHARKQGYLPPLAWTVIDDARERPRDWEYDARPRLNRAEKLDELDELGLGINEACQHLQVSRDALEKWCERYDARRREWLPPLARDPAWDDSDPRSVIYSRMVDRDQPSYWANGVAEGGVA